MYQLHNRIFYGVAYLYIFFTPEMIVTAEHTMETFNQLLKDKYPELFGGFLVHDTHKFYNKILLTNYICHANTSIVEAANSTLNRTVRSAVTVNIIIILKQIIKCAYTTRTWSENWYTFSGLTHRNLVNTIHIIRCIIYVLYFLIF